MSNSSRAREIFEQAIEIQVPDEQLRFIQSACNGDAELLAEVQSLLNANQNTGELFETQDIPQGSSDAEADSNDYQRKSTRDTMKDYNQSEIIGPYKLLQEIGSGGMGQVWMAEQQKPVRRRVALKLIKAGMDTKLVIARFEAERQALALMDHPHIAKVFDAGTTDDGRPFFVMEYVRGKPITRFADDNHLTIPERLELFEQVCNAVQHAHHKGIIHRDLKPTNVLVSAPDGKPISKVIDFGIAKATSQQLTDLTLYTLHDQFIGTPQYMSPEQASGSVDIDTRTDVYSLGVILFELLTGTTPFPREELQAVGLDAMKQIIIEKEPPKPSTRISLSEQTIGTLAASRKVEPKRLGLLVRGELDWIVMKALDKDRSRRYETPNSFSDDIVAYLKGESIDAAPPSRMYSLQKFVRKNKGPVFASAAFSGLLGVGLIGTSWAYYHTNNLANQERSARIEAVESKNAESKARETAELEAYIANIGLAQTAIANDNWSGARQRLAACPEHLRGWEWGFLTKQTSAFIGKLPKYDTSDNPQLSSYLNLVCCWIDEQTLQLFDLECSPVGKKMRHTEDVESFMFHSDQPFLTSITERGGLHTWNLDGTSMRSLDLKTKDDLKLIACSKAGIVVFREYQDDTKEIQFIGKQNAVTAIRVSDFSYSPQAKLLALLVEGRIELRDLSGTVARTFETKTIGESSVKLSPTGKHLAQWHEQSKRLKLWTTEGALITEIDSREYTYLGDVEFSVDGRFCVSESGDGTITILDLYSKEQTVVKGKGSDPAFHIEQSSEVVTLTEGNGVGDLSIWHLEGNRHSQKVNVEVGQWYMYYADIGICGELVWGSFGGDDSLEFLSKLDGNWAGPITCERESDSVFAEYENQIFSKSWGESGVRVWDDLGQVGELELPTDDVDTVSGTERVLLLGEWLVNRSHFDCGLRTVPNSDFGNVQARSLLAFDSLDAGSFEIPSQNIRDTPSKKCELPSQERILIASGNQLQVLDAKTEREMASIYFSSAVVGLTVSEGGNCVFVKCQEESYVLDQLPLESKKAYWRALPKLIPQAEELVRETLRSTIATSDTENSILSMPSISEPLRFSALCACRRELEKIKSKAEWVEQEINQGNPFAVRLHREKWNKSGAVEGLENISRRVVDEVNELLTKSNTPEQDEFEKKVYRFIENILEDDFREPAEYQEALETAVQSIKELGNNARRLHLVAAANFRLGNIEESMRVIEKSKEISGPASLVDALNAPLQLLCHLERNQLNEAETSFDRLEKRYRQLSEGYPRALAGEAVQRFASIVKKPIIEKLIQPNLTLDEYQEAFGAAQGGISRFGPDIGWLHLLGLAQLRLGKPDVALRWIERSNEADGKLYSNIPVEVLCLVSLGEIEAARNLMVDFEVKYSKFKAPSDRLISLTEEARQKLDATTVSAKGEDGK